MKKDTSRLNILLDYLSNFIRLLFIWVSSQACFILIKLLFSHLFNNYKNVAEYNWKYSWQNMIISEMSKNIQAALTIHMLSDFTSDIVLS